MKEEENQLGPTHSHTLILALGPQEILFTSLTLHAGQVKAREGSCPTQGHTRSISIQVSWFAAPESTLTASPAPTILWPPELPRVP